MVGIPFDIPIFILMYRKDLYDKHGIKVPTTMEEFMAAVKAIDGAERANGIFGTTGQLKSGHYSLELRLDRAGCGRMAARSSTRTRCSPAATPTGIAGLEYMLELVKHMPPAADRPGPGTAKCQ